MMHGRIFSTFRLALTLFVFSLTACSMFGGAGKPATVIVSPPSGSQYRDGEDVAVQTTSADPTGIVRVELIVDNVIVRTDPSPNPQTTFSLIQTWKASPGNHTIIVRAYNSSGSASDPAAISVNVLQELAQAGSSSASSSAASTASSASSATTTVASSSATSSLSSSSSAASSVACVNGSAFVVDVTIPDGTNMAPLQEFSKVWRISNTGACSWDAGYHLVHTSGTAMTTGIAVAVSATAPGATTDVTVPMKAPAGSGIVTGVWRMRAPNGALFGNSVTIKINVVGGSSSSASSSAAPGTCSGTPNIASFTASATGVAPGTNINVNYATDFTLSWGAVTNADSVEIDNGIGGVATPDNRTLNPGGSGPKTYTLTARCGANVATRQVVVTIGLPPAVAIPPAPTLGVPADGWVFRNFPRTATFTWSAVSFSGGVTYNIEIQINTGTWQNHTSQSGLAGISYTMSAFSGDNQGRWRVWATSPTAGAGAKSDWRSFSFNTAASQYSGNWYNDDSGTGGVTKIFITNSGQTLNVHPYGKCTPTDCDWGSKSQTFNGEPFVIGGFPSGGSHQLTITLNNAAGTSLKVVDFNGVNTFTYYFHK